MNDWRRSCVFTARANFWPLKTWLITKCVRARIRLAVMLPGRRFIHHCGLSVESLEWRTMHGITIVQRGIIVETASRFKNGISSNTRKEIPWSKHRLKLTKYALASVDVALRKHSMCTTHEYLPSLRAASGRLYHQPVGITKLNKKQVYSDP